MEFEPRSERKSRAIARATAILVSGLAALFGACLDFDLGKAPAPMAQRQEKRPRQDPALTAAGLLSETLQAARFPGMKPPPRPVSDADAKPRPPLPFCGAKPVIETADVCGRPVPVAASVSWSACALNGPHASGPTPSTDASIGEQPPARLSSGLIQATMNVAAPSCAAPTEATVTRHTVFSISVTEPEVSGGRSTAGVVLSKAEHNLDAPPREVEFQLDVTTSAERDDHTNTLRLTGTLSISFAAEASAPPTQTLRGTLQAEGDLSGEIQIQDLVLSHGCPTPVGGLIVRPEHTLTFGPQCGDASLDGQPISLQPGGQRPQEGDRKPQ
jgi:hypothetical protein